jgi:hypothetical protein
MISSGLVRWTLQLLVITVLFGLAFADAGPAVVEEDELSVEELEAIVDDIVAQGAGANETNSPAGDAPCEASGPCEDVADDAPPDVNE